MVFPNMIKRVVAGMGFSFSTVLVTFVGQVVSVPVLLTSWGLEIYGEWLTLTNIVASLSILNLGVQSYVSNLLITHYVRGELEEGTNLLHAALRLYAALISLALGATLTMFFLPGMLAWLKITAIPSIDARLIIGVQGILASYAILGGLLMSLFRVTQQLPRQLGYGLIERILFIFAPVTVAAFGGYPIHAMLIMGLLIAIIACIEIRDVNRRSPYTIGISQSTWKESVSLVVPSLMFFLVSIAATILLTGMTVVISITIGAAAVAIFSTTLMLTNFMRVIVNQGLNVLWPEITASAAGQNDPGQLMRWHKVTLKLVGTLILVSAAGISLLGPDILAIWTHRKIMVDPWLNLLLVIYLIIQVPALVSGVFGLATNRQWEMSKIQIITTVISILMAVCIISKLGVRGAAIALIGGQVVGSLWIMGAVCRWTSDTLPSLLHDGIVRGIPTLLVIVLISIGIWYILPGLVGRAIGLIGLVMVSIYIGWRTWFTKSERNIFITKLHAVFSKYPDQVSAKGSLV
jgi:O-antigen/teichoic acid export membrane protein